MNEFSIWSNFFVAAAGGSAALTGLVFVGVSISLERILKIPKISGRAVDALTLMLLILMVSLICLVPGQTAHIIGLEILFIALLSAIVILRSDLALIRSIPMEWKRLQLYNMIVNQVVILPYLLTAVALTLSYSRGIYFLVPAFIFSFVKSLVDAWVLLIEIHR